MPNTVHAQGSAAGVSRASTAALNLPVSEQLQACEAAYLTELASRTSSSCLPNLTAEHRAANKSVFLALKQMQQELDAHHQVHPHGVHAPAFKYPPMSLTTTSTYPEGLHLQHFLELKQILPIPDINQVSDCDTIYRFLIAQNFKVATTEERNVVVLDILHYILMREMYDLNHILVHPQLVTYINGGDGLELLQEAVKALEEYDPKHEIRKPTVDAANSHGKPSSPNPKKNSSSSAEDPLRYVKMVQKARSKLSRLMLYDAWRTWNIGVDRTGHTILYQKPHAEHLRNISTRWPYEPGSYNAHRGAAPASLEKRHHHHSSSTSEDPLREERNLLVRLHLRCVEKGRRMSRLLQHDQQRLLKQHGEWLAPDWAAEALAAANTQKKGSTTGKKSAKEDSARETTTHLTDAGGTTCLVDVADISLGTFTASKYDNVLKVFKIVSLMGQSYYPENMHKMLIINGGFVFRMLFKLVKPWLDPQTQKKIIVLSHTNKYTVDQLVETRDEIHLATPLSLGPSSFPAASLSQTLVSPDVASSVASCSSTCSLSVNSFPHASGDLSVEKTISDGSKMKMDKKHFELYRSLTEFIPSPFIPAWYGGQLNMKAVPYHYAHLLYPEAGILPFLHELQMALDQEKSTPHGSSPSLSFLSHNEAFFQSLKTEAYWQAMDKLQAHPRFREALDVIQTVAPPEVLPDSLLLPMLYYNAAHAGGAPRRHVDPMSSVDSPHVVELNADAVLPVGPVTEVEAQVFGMYLKKHFQSLATGPSPF